MTQLYRVLYCSRNLIPGDAESIAGHIRSILEVSRRNNARDGVTGGLLFSAGCFAQVLEGPTDAVERAFERIQCDNRHGEVVVLEAGVVSAPNFPEWSMAFNGDAAANPLAELALDAAFKGQSNAGDALLSLMRAVITQEDERNIPTWTSPGTTKVAAVELF